MKSLVELYGQGNVTEGITEVMFKAAYPVDTEAKIKTMQTTIAGVMSKFFGMWRNRLVEAYKPHVEEERSPQAIMSDVPWITADEYTELCSHIDSFFPEDTDAVGALRIADFMSYTDMMQNTAQQILQEVAMEYLSKKRIVNPFQNNGARIVPMTSSPAIIKP